MADTTPALPADETPVPRWRRAVGRLRRVAAAPFNGIEALVQTGLGYRHFLQPMLNGAIGDQLVARYDPRAIRLSFRRHNADVAPADLALTDGPRPTLVFVHGLMGDEHIWQTGPAGLLRYGPQLAQDLPVRCLYVRYNTGLHISQNGRALSQLLTELVQTWPEAIGSLTLIGHSMGGLVIRSAGHYAVASPAAPASAPWLAHLRQVFLLGVPNEGSFLEQNSFLTSLALRRLDWRLSRLLADTIDRRSAGIRDLRHARLVDEDWQNPHADDLVPPRTPVPPLPGVDYHLLAATLLRNADSVLAQYFGDGLVGGGSATGSVFRRAERVHVRIFPRQHHGTLLADADVYAYLREHLQARPDQATPMPSV